MVMLLTGCDWQWADAGGHRGEKNGLLVVYAAEPQQTIDPVVIDLTITDAESGGLEAQFELGQFYHDGVGVEQNDQQAFHWWEKAAKRGHVKAMIRLASLYEQGLGTEKDYDQALRWTKKAVGKHDAEAAYRMGLYYESGLVVNQDLDKAAEYYLKAAEREYPPAQFKAGLLYHHGQGVKQDLVLAEKWLWLAQQNGVESAGPVLHALRSTTTKDEAVIPH